MTDKLKPDLSNQKQLMRRTAKANAKKTSEKVGLHSQQENKILKNFVSTETLKESKKR